MLLACLVDAERFSESISCTLLCIRSGDMGYFIPCSPNLNKFGINTKYLFNILRKVEISFT